MRLRLKQVYKCCFEQIDRFQSAFTAISFFHVSREHNKEADSLSKASLMLEAGTWTVLEPRDGLVLESVRSFHV